MSDYDYFTYRGIDIGYSVHAHFLVNMPHGYGDDCRLRGYARTLRECMDLINEHFEEVGT